MDLVKCPLLGCNPTAVVARAIRAGYETPL